MNDGITLVFWMLMELSTHTMRPHSECVEGAVRRHVHVLTIKLPGPSSRRDQPIPSLSASAMMYW